MAEAHHALSIVMLLMWNIITPMGTRHRSPSKEEKPCDEVISMSIQLDTLLGVLYGDVCNSDEDGEFQLNSLLVPKSLCSVECLRNTDLVAHFSALENFHHTCLKRDWPQKKFEFFIAQYDARWPVWQTCNSWDTKVKGRWVGTADATHYMQYVLAPTSSLIPEKLTMKVYKTRQDISKATQPDEKDCRSGETSVQLDCSLVFDVQDQRTLISSESSSLLKGHTTAVKCAADYQYERHRWVGAQLLGDNEHQASINLLIVGLDDTFPSVIIQETFDSEVLPWAQLTDHKVF